MGNYISSLWNYYFPKTKNCCIFQIQINKENKIKCSILKEENKEQIIQDFVDINISFDMNEIIIGNKTENSINFFNDLIEQPNTFKQYKITYQNKEYSVIADVLFALYLSQIKK